MALALAYAKKWRLHAKPHEETPAATLHRLSAYRPQPFVAYVCNVVQLIFFGVSYQLWLLLHRRQYYAIRLAVVSGCSALQWSWRRSARRWRRRLTTEMSAAKTKGKRKKERSELESETLQLVVRAKMLGRPSWDKEKKWLPLATLLLLLCILAGISSRRCV